MLDDDRIQNVIFETKGHGNMTSIIRLINKFLEKGYRYFQYRERYGGNLEEYVKVSEEQ